MELLLFLASTLTACAALQNIQTLQGYTNNLRLFLIIEAAFKKTSNIIITDNRITLTRTDNGFANARLEEVEEFIYGLSE